VVVDRLTNFALFLPIKMTDLVDKMAKLYVNEVIRLNGVLVSIILDRVNPDKKNKGCLNCKLTT
jgi:hypothetical protein